MEIHVSSWQQRHWFNVFAESAMNERQRFFQDEVWSLLRISAAETSNLRFSPIVLVWKWSFLVTKVYAFRLDLIFWPPSLSFIPQNQESGENLYMLIMSTHYRSYWNGSSLQIFSLTSKSTLPLVTFIHQYLYRLNVFKGTEDKNTNILPCFFSSWKILSCSQVSWERGDLSSRFWDELLSCAF